MLAVIAGGPWLSGRRVPKALRPQEEAPLGHHDLSRSEPGEHRVAVAHRLAHADLALDELALLVLDRQVDDPALAERLDGRARDDDGSLPAAGGEHHGHVHAEPQASVRVRDLDPDLGRAWLGIDPRVDVCPPSPEGQAPAGGHRAPGPGPD